MRRLLAALLLLLIALPCAAYDYTPMIYPLRPGLIPPLALAGSVAIVNAQPSTEPQIVYKYGFTKWKASMNAVTEVMVEQTRQELGLGSTAPAAPDKTVEFKVTSLLSDYKFFSWASDINVEVRLGDGTSFNRKVHHASGNPLQDLNGCIAEAVWVLLREGPVRAYLEAPVASGAKPAATAEPATPAPAATAPTPAEPAAPASPPAD